MLEFIFSPIAEAVFLSFVGIVAYFPYVLVFLVCVLIIYLDEKRRRDSNTAAQTATTVLMVGYFLFMAWMYYDWKTVLR
mgnify:CR=1 FL=1